MAGMGHEDAFPSPGLSAGSGRRKRSFAADRPHSFGLPLDLHDRARRTFESTERSATVTRSVQTTRSRDMSRLDGFTTRILCCGVLARLSPKLIDQAWGDTVRALAEGGRIADANRAVPS